MCKVHGLSRCIVEQPAQTVSSESFNRTDRTDVLRITTRHCGVVCVECWKSQRASARPVPERSAVRTSAADYQASWSDALEMIAQRHPRAAESVQVLRVQGFLGLDQVFRSLRFKVSVFRCLGL